MGRGSRVKKGEMFEFFSHGRCRKFGPRALYQALPAGAGDFVMPGLMRIGEAAVARCAL